MGVESTVALFGESEKGPFETGIFLSNLDELHAELGNPPAESLGLHFAIQTIYYERDLLFFRVREEGFSTDDYQGCFRLLRESGQVPPLAAICAPGVGSRDLLDEILQLCHLYKTFLITTEKDLYDYLSCF